tara:strand:+ start:498 stop:842 length:345 start_codon:yes stop_codon:yes gene_type:complete
MKFPIIITAPKFIRSISWFIDIVAITLFPFIITREPMSDDVLQHETIHIHQQKELFVLLFYLLYVFDWAKGIIKYKNTRKAYFRIRFEQEAYAKMYEENYLLTRKKYSWRDYKV